MNSLFKPRQMLWLIRIHFLEIIREPGVLFWGIGFPILMAMGLGVAFSQKKEMVRTVAVVQQSNCSVDTNTLYQTVLEAKELGNVVFHFQKTEWPDAMLLLKRGSINLVIVENEKGRQYHFDPANPDAQLTFLMLSRMLNHPEKGKERSGKEEILPLTVSGTRYIDFLIPGLIAMGIMMSSLWGISYTLIDRRSRRLLRRMVATPMRKSHFLLSLILVRVAMNGIESVVLFIFAHFVFGISIEGNLPALVLLFVSGNFAFCGIAVLLSCRTANTEVGNGLISAISMPMMVISGIFFSYQHFPEWILPMIKHLPLSLLADSFRALFIEGAGMTVLSLPMAILMAIGFVTFTTGLKLFKWN